MKKIILVFFLLLICSETFCQGYFIINGTIENFPKGIYLALYRIDNDGAKLIANRDLDNNKFIFSCITKGNDIERYLLKATNGKISSIPLDLYIKEGTIINISGNGIYPRNWNVESNIKEQQESNSFINNAAEQWHKLQLQNYIIYNDLYQYNPSNKELHLKIIAEAKKRDDIYFDIIHKDIEFMRGRELSQVWTTTLSAISKFSFRYKNFPYKNELKELYNNLTDEQKSKIDEETKINIFPPTLIQQYEKYDDVPLYDLNGNIHHISDYKGKFRLLCFWNKESNIAVEDILRIKKLNKNCLDKISVININVDSEQIWKSFTNNKKLNWMNFNEHKGKAGLCACYNFYNFPGFILLSPDGKSLSRWNGYVKDKYENIFKRFNYNIKKIPSIITNGNNKIINYPDFKTANDYSLYIKQIEITDSATILNLRSYYYPDNWISIASKSKLTDNNGNSYKLIKGEGINLDVKNKIDKRGYIDFILYFDKIPNDLKEINFTEGDVKNAWNIDGIKLF